MIGKLVSLAVLGGLLSFFIHLLFTLDVNKRIYVHSPGPCSPVEGIRYGAEDIAMIESKSIAFITSGIYYMSKRSEKVTGEIFLYDFNNNPSDQHKATPLQIVGMKNRESFRPHGLSHWESPEGIYLYVISHTFPGFKHSVEVFLYNEKKNVLEHQRSIRDSKFVRPNDLTIVAKDAFILSNDGTAQTELTNLFEILSGYEGGSIVYYDGNDSHWIMNKATSPNGIIVDKSKQHLIVSHINKETISVYKLAKDFKSVSHVSDVPLLTASDNFFIDKEGALWTGTHPILIDALGHLGDCDDLTKHAPSQILRIVFSPDWKEWTVREVFADDGSRLSGSSVAVHFKGQLLLGTVCRQMMHCTIAHPAVIN